jgi:transposase
LDAQERIAKLEAELSAKDARIAEQDERIAELIRQVAELVDRLGQNSRNSHKPPSSDPPSARAGRRGKGGAKSRRRRGGQTGHRGFRRDLVPADKVDAVVNLFPSECENCWERLAETPDAKAKRYQTTEIPPLKPHTTEVRRHAVTCGGCGFRTRAAYDESKIPASPFGPRLMAMVALLTGVYHLSRRKTVQLLSDIVGLPISLGAVSSVEARVSDAICPAVDEAWNRVQEASVKHTDGTTWLQSGTMCSLWTIATTMATVFKIVADGSKKTLEPLYGKLRGILVSDRAKALNFWAMERRQICWAHLLRKFVSFSERDGPAGALGRELLDYTGILFGYWHDHKSGTLSSERFRAWMLPVKQQIEGALGRAVAAGFNHMSGSCADILAHKEALWTFVERNDVEPTNNHAEREIRAFVLWRRRSFGTQSTRGNLFAERVMTVAHTARKQCKNVLAFLTACCRAQLSDEARPSLFAAAQA